MVERPSQLVKELVENSIDAGANEIIVEVSEGGRTLLVKDNGVGILKEDLAKALLRHTTSKIKKAEELWSLQSFGFRGEALASAASVSHLTLTSRPRHYDQASEIVCRFGESGSVEEVGHEFGTSIRVEKLFENLPARLKFLKSPGAEVGAIKQMLRALAMSHPGVGFQVFEDREIDTSLGSGRELARAC